MTYYVDSGAINCSAPFDNDYDPSTQTCGSKKNLAIVYNTIQGAIDGVDLKGKDIVEVRADTAGGSKQYSEAVYIGIYDGGSSGNPVTLQARSGDTITISSLSATALVIQASHIEVKGFKLTGGPYGCYISSTSKSAIKDITLRNLHVTNCKSTGLVITQNTNARLNPITYVYVYDSTFDYNGNTGALVQSASAAVQNVYFYRCKANFNNLDGDLDRQGFGVGANATDYADTSWLCDGGHDCSRTIAYNNPYKLYQNNVNKRKLTYVEYSEPLSLSDGEWSIKGTTLFVDTGVDMSLNKRGVHVQYGKTKNIVYQDCLSSYNGGEASGSYRDGNGFYFAHAEESIAERCYAHHNDGGGIMSGYSDNITIRYNILANNGQEPNSKQGAGIPIRRNCDNMYIYNNTIYGNNYGGIRMQDDGGGGTITIKNNIISNNGLYGINDTGPNYTIIQSSNIIYQNISGALNNVSGGYINSDPLFVNAPGGDFRVRPGSPCENAGEDLNITTDYAKNTVHTTTPEIGAYEIVKIHKGPSPN